MSYAVEIIIATTLHRRSHAAIPTGRLPFFHDTIAGACAAGADFLNQNGTYIASKGPASAIAMYQVVDDGGDIVIAPTRNADPCECELDERL